MLEQIILEGFKKLLANKEIKNLVVEFLNPIIQDAVAKALQKQNEKSLISIEEICIEFKVSKPTVHSWFKRFNLAKYKVPGSSRTYIKRNDLINILTSIKPLQRGP